MKLHFIVDQQKAIFSVIFFYNFLTSQMDKAESIKLLNRKTVETATKRRMVEGGMWLSPRTKILESSALNVTIIFFPHPKILNFEKIEIEIKLCKVQNF